MKLGSDNHAVAVVKSEETINKRCTSGTSSVTWKNVYVIRILKSQSFDISFRSRSLSTLWKVGHLVNKFLNINKIFTLTQSGLCSATFKHQIFANYKQMMIMHSVNTFPLLLDCATFDTLNDLTTAARYSYNQFTLPQSV